MELLLWDSLDRLKEMEDNSVDSIVCDPPYGISFMWKKWDYDVPQKEVWAECLRVLKPWWHALIACWTRTQHRMAVNIEDWGFEIRDIIAWVYGSWFPKSHNIGKAVDKLQGNERENLGTYAENSIDWSKRTKNPNIRQVNYGASDIWDKQQTKWTSPYEGRGTALKPACEYRTLCRKPLSEKTIAKNVLKHWTGGINIDECRVGTETITVNRHSGYNSNSLVESTKWKRKGEKEKIQWRFPANLIHDWSDEVVGLFPNSKSTTGKRGGQGFHNSLGRADKKRKDWQIISGHSDSWSAARFFYCAKASKSERNKGLEGFEEKVTKVTNMYEMERKDGTIRTLASKKNNHPTVKPIKLMQYLCRLITPVWWTILDPYMWSGSTGIWAKLWGFDFIGIEREEEYVELAKARIQARE